jgi:hypothetical protein
VSRSAAPQPPDPLAFPSAELLRDDDNGPQAVRVGPHLVIQFHPEVTPAIAGRWLLHPDGRALDTQCLLDGLARENHITRANANRLFSAHIGRALGDDTAPIELAAVGRGESVFPERRDQLAIAAFWAV